MSAINYLAFFLFNLAIKRVFNLKQYILDVIFVGFLWPMFPWIWERLYLPIFRKALKK